jgi:phytoene dehydrogenase-like protein
VNSTSEDTTVDAVVIGAGHHGLVAAAMLADAGWDVVVLEAQSTPGGAVRSAELTPGYTTDLFSAFYPLSVSSPALRDLHLEDHGLRWTRAPVVVGHPRSADDTQAPVIHPDRDRTAAELDEYSPGEGANWLRVTEEWAAVKRGVLDALFAPFPPVKGPMRLVRALGTSGALRLAHQLLLPATVLGEKLFVGDAARTLLMGNAMHADIPLDAPGSGVMGYIMTMLAQDAGFPVPVGGAGELTAALVRRAESAGAQVQCGQPVDRIEVRGSRAVGVRTTDGRRHGARRAVIADVSAPQLFDVLLPPEAISSGLARSMEHFVWDTPVVKVNYALDAPIPWRSPNLSRAGTVHVGADGRGLIRWMADLTSGTVPKRPFMLFGQMTTADATRSPHGTESAWAYTHLPRRVADRASAEEVAAAVDRTLEEHAPGFSEHIVGRHLQTPGDLESDDANLHLGAVNGGTSALFQQLVFRPFPGFGRPDTPIEALFLGSAAVPPGGGVHGMCGRNAARAALASDGARGWPRRSVNRKVITLLTK